MWTLNGDQSVPIGGGYKLKAQMHFETLDQGQSRGSERFRVSTSGYRYAVLDSDEAELIAAHWHPNGSSPYVDPHWHVGSVLLAPDGVFLERAHIPSPRVSFEHMVRWTIENLDEVTPAHGDWDERLRRTEEAFERHKTW
ncbi:MAG TPA: hypothetical protein VHO29_04065 [Marmoricola sp.]|nr:hypothetical protein [Marmoricola sp.]